MAQELADADFWDDYVEVSRGFDCTWIESKEECERAARQLGFSEQAGNSIALKRAQKGTPKVH